MSVSRKRNSPKRAWGRNRQLLRVERWLEDTFTEVELVDRVVCEDVAGLSMEELDKLLASIPSAAQSLDQ